MPQSNSPMQYQLSKEDKLNKVDFHRERAGYWQTRYVLHATSGKPGRAKNARVMYNFHMKQLAETLLGHPVDLIP
jgi:hypothetical protein